MRTLLFAMLLTVPATSALAQTNPTKAATSPVDTALVPTGLGTLKQDEITMGIKTGALLLKITPLNERVIRTAAPDTYNRLHALADSKRAAATDRAGGKTPELFLVSFFSYQPDVTFQPEDVQIEYNGRLLRPAAIMPLTPSWGKQRMAQQETVAAVYVFADPIDYELPMVVHYGMDQNSEWQNIINKLDVERAKILSRQQKN